MTLKLKATVYASCLKSCLIYRNMGFGLWDETYSEVRLDRSEVGEVSGCGFTLRERIGADRILEFGSSEFVDSKILLEIRVLEAIVKFIIVILFVKYPVP